MWRKVLAAVLLLVSLAAGAVLLGAEKLVSVVANRALDGSGLALSYDRFELKLFEGKLALSNLLLIDEAANKPLLRIGEAKLSVKMRELLFGDNAGGQLSGRDIDIYLYLEEESESEGEWEPGTWLGYRNLLPGTADIDNLKLHWRGNDLEAVTRLAQIRARPGDDDERLHLEVDGFHREADLHVEGRIATEATGLVSELNARASS